MSSDQALEDPHPEKTVPHLNALVTADSGIRRTAVRPKAGHSRAVVSGLGNQHRRHHG